MIQLLQKLSLLFVIASISVIASTQAKAQITDPRDIAGNVLWLDGADVDGDFVNGGNFVNGLSGSVWVDKSPALNASASQTLASATPTVINSAFNNMTAVEFDGNDFLDVDSAAFGILSNVQGATLIGVLVPEAGSSNSANRALMVSSGTGSQQTRAGINVFDGFGTNLGGTGDFGAAGRRLDSDGFQRIEGGDAVAGELATVAGVFDYQAGEISLFVDGVQETMVNSFQTPGPTSATDSLNIRVGADAFLTTPRGFFEGQIAELIIYDRVLSEAELGLIDQYVIDKWTPINVPEPNSLVLFGGVFAMLLRRSRKTI